MLDANGVRYLMDIQEEREHHALRVQYKVWPTDEAAAELNDFEARMHARYIVPKWGL